MAYRHHKHIKFFHRLNPLCALKAERGIAMLIALFALTLMIFIATEVSYDTSVEYIVASQQVQRIKAYYAAKAGLEMSLSSAFNSINKRWSPSAIRWGRKRACSI